MSNESKTNQISDIRVKQFTPIDSPTLVKKDIPISDAVSKHVLQSRETIRKAIAGEDRRALVVLGPCSIHEEKAAYEYASRLKDLAQKVSDTTLLVMRVYFEKPRTTIGWKGLINDPKLDGSQDINLGLRLGRKILLKINEMGLPCASEFLDPIVPQYTADLVSWVAIGARTTESQTHREMASGLSMPVGFKNSTDGELQTAMDAMVSARHPHSFLGIDQDGKTAIVRTAGNPDVHIVLRGGNSGPNYGPPHIAFAKASLGIKGKERKVMIDCSHGNSNKDYRKQPQVYENLIGQIVQGETSILGMMLESHLNDGQQKLGNSLQYGVSITDGCIGWDTTSALILKGHEQLKKLF